MLRTSLFFSTLVFSAITAFLAGTASVLFFANVIMPATIIFTEFIAFFTCLAFTGLNTFFTRPSDMALGKIGLFVVYVMVIWFGIDSMPIMPPRWPTSVNVGGSPGLSLLIGAVAGIIHFLLLKSGVRIFRYPPEDPSP